MFEARAGADKTSKSMLETFRAGLLLTFTKYLFSASIYALSPRMFERSPAICDRSLAGDER
jgi:hypothetical protein